MCELQLNLMFHLGRQLALNSPFPIKPNPCSSSSLFQLSEQVDDVSIFCDTDLTVVRENTDEPLRWTFKVETEVRLNDPMLPRRNAVKKITCG